MNTQETNDLLDQLKQLMYGHNYEITLGIDLFDNCSNLHQFTELFKAKYTRAKPEVTNYILFTENEFWNEIDNAFNYRGDDASGLQLSPEKEQRLNFLQNEYRNLVRTFIDSRTTIYAYADVEGIPGYPVYWDYRFLLLTENNKCYFIHGSSSD